MASAAVPLKVSIPPAATLAPFRLSERWSKLVVSLTVSVRSFDGFSENSWVVAYGKKLPVTTSSDGLTPVIMSVV